MLHGKAWQDWASEPSGTKDPPQMPISEGAWSVWLVCVCGVRRRGWEGGGGQLLSRLRANAEMGLSGEFLWGWPAWGGFGVGGP